MREPEPREIYERHTYIENIVIQTEPHLPNKIIPEIRELILTNTGIESYDLEGKRDWGVTRNFVGKKQLREIYELAITQPNIDIHTINSLADLYRPVEDLEVIK